MVTRLQFGPMTFSIDDDSTLGSELRAFIPSRDEHRRPDIAIRIEAARGRSTGPHDDCVVVRTGERVALEGPDFGAILVFPPPSSAPPELLPIEVEAWLASTAARAGFPLTSLIGNLLALVGPSRGLLAVHAAGVLCVGCGGVQLVAAPTGAGKSTWAHAAGASAFCYNAALVEPATGLAWPLPWTGDRDDAVVPRDATEICVIGVVVSGGDAGRAPKALRVDETHALLRHAACLEPARDAFRVTALVAELARRVPTLALSASVPIVESAKSLNCGATSVRAR